MKEKRKITPRDLYKISMLNEALGHNKQAGRGMVLTEESDPEIYEFHKFCAEWLKKYSK